MPSCCRAGPCEEIFGARAARRTLRRYRTKGLDDLEHRMVASASGDGLEGARVLEIGGGIGALQSELLARGAERGEVVELVSAYEPYARELARERGLEERTSFRVVDLLADPNAVERADVVVLNRVVCCSPDGVRLAGVAGRLATSLLILSFPRERFVVKIGVVLVNGTLRLMRRTFRVFLHSREALVAAAEAEGLRLAEDGHGLVWQFVALRRAA